MTLNTVKKIGPVLDLFTTEHPEWRMTDIARALGTPKSSAHSLVSTLAEIGLLSVAPSGRYRLGLNLLSLAERMRTSMDILKQAGPSMQELARSSRETVLLAMLDRNEVVYVERAEGTHPMVRLAGVQPGARVPAHCTAVGKVLLAYRDPGETRRFIRSADLRRFTAQTITDPEKLEDALIEVRARGYAIDHQEIVADIACIAAPVADQFGTVIAGLSISMPAYRFEGQRAGLTDNLKTTASTISRIVGEAGEMAPGDEAEPEEAGDVAALTSLT
jgi:DNA-binding IclR family transcriptional regulator